MKRCTDITLLLDKSDSMENIRDTTIEMLNTFIDDRRKDPDECVLSLFQFSSHAPGYGDPLTRTFSGLSVKDCPRITTSNYQLQGMTALNDAMAFTIDDVGKRLAELPEHERPDRVLIALMTDGAENDSRKYPSEDMKRGLGNRTVLGKVNHQRNQYGWEFMMLGADMTQQRAEEVSSSVGIVASNALPFKKSSIRGAGQVMIKAVSAYASPLGAAGPATPTGPGIYALDPSTRKMSQDIKDEANDVTGNSNVTPPTKSTRKTRKK